MSKDIINVPKASMLMGSMRSMGYSFEAAVADVIDNSISAGCKTVRVLFPATKADKLAVGILDDGCGMSSDTLVEAMRYGSDCDAGRGENGLGRFGLGMKSASMSQCRVLTVASRHQGELSVLRWDYNYIQCKKNWYVQVLDDAEIEEIPYIDSLRNAQGDGTLVVWEDFDVIAKATDGQVFEALKETMPRMGDYLSLIYHRFLASGSLCIMVNDRKLKGRDPFLEHHSKTMHKKETVICTRDSAGRERQIKVKAFVLPFASYMSAEDLENAGGAANLRSLQGFYVYRNMRLIIWGTWFGRRFGGELTKNARIRVDIPNSLDDMWGIDITKRAASIPKAILSQLRKTVTDVMDTATRQQTHRGRRENVDNDINYVWNRMQGRGEHFYYELNKDNLLVKSIMDRIPAEYHDDIDTLLSEIEKNIPIRQIYIDQCNDVVEVQEEADRLQDLYQLGITMIDMVVSSGVPIDTAIKNVMATEPVSTKQELRGMFEEYYNKK